MAKTVLPIHITGMDNIKGQQAINAILDSMNNEIENHKWTITTQDYTNLKFEKYLESGSILTVDQTPKDAVPIVGTHNGRKVYIGDLDVYGNLNVTDLALRDNVNTTAKSWEVRGTDSKTGSILGTMYDSESFKICIRDPLPLTEVASIPNDISDKTYGSTIYNKETTSAAGMALDTKTFEKTEWSYYYTYPTRKWTESSSRGESETITKDALTYMKEYGAIGIGNQTFFPQITTLNAKACWSPGQAYGVFQWNNGTSATMRLLSWSTFSTYEDYYAFVQSYPSTNGKSGTGVMIPSLRFINSWYTKGTQTVAGAVNTYKIITRRFISEEFDKRNSGIVKVDIAYRI